MRNRLLLLFMLLIFDANVFAQPPILQKEPSSKSSGSDFFDRIYIGGNIGLQFGTQTILGISPQIGYKFTDQLIAGFGVQYYYFKYSDDYTKYSSNIYGGSLFAKYLLTDNLFLHTEYEVLNLAVPIDYGSFRREEVTSILVGGGYRQMLGERSSVDFLVLFNLNESRYSPYSNPIIRVGFGFGY